MSKSGPIRIYTPESQLRTPVKLFRAMWDDLMGSRELAWRLFVRDTSALYRQSFLGVFWAIVPPILTGFVFILLQSKGIVDFGKTDVPYPVFVLVGTTFWQVFTESLNAPLNCVKMAKPVLAKINFPREALIVSAFYRVLFNLSIKILIIVGIFVYFKVTLTWGILLSLIAILMLILLGLTIGLMITPMGMLYTDISSALTVFIQIWFFLTPVVYPPPKSFPYSLIASVNPVSPLLENARNLLIKGSFINVNQFILVASVSVVFLILAWIFYRVSLPIIIERMSA